CAVCLRIGPYCLEIQQSAENRVKSVRAWHPRALTPLVESDASV
ncbi:TPA: magnesium/cobalt efflux protein, partial [Pseudomonas aeruginosa]|nr:magnesium/cobalt efflux protein [Pseudomonas aeruginosa]